MSMISGAGEVRPRTKLSTAASPKSPTPDRVLQTFNTWAFKRQQPTEPELLLETIAAAIGRSEPLPFVLYWGKGPRSHVAAPDLECLDYLRKMTSRIEAVYTPGAAVTLIFTDTHASHNGHAPRAIERYYAEVDAAARERGFNGEYLSRLVASVAGRVAVAQPGVAILDKLKGCAAKWYRGGASVEAGAAEYYRMNMAERQAIEHAYPHAIFVTFNSAEYRELFPPSLPVFYMYSLRKGVAVKPWFMDETAAPAEDCLVADGNGGATRAQA